MKDLMLQYNAKKFTIGLLHLPLHFPWRGPNDIVIMPFQLGFHFSSWSVILTAIYDTSIVVHQVPDEHCQQHAGEHCEHPAQGLRWWRWGDSWGRGLQTGWGHVGKTARGLCSSRGMVTCLLVWNRLWNSLINCAKITNDSHQTCCSSRIANFNNHFSITPYLLSKTRWHVLQMPIGKMAWCFVPMQKWQIYEFN